MIFITNSILFLLLISFLVIFFILFINNFLASPYIPTPKKSLKKIIDAAELAEDDILYDLGSGDGRLVLEAAKLGIKNSVGFELNPLLVIYSRIKAKFKSLKNTRFIRKSYWNADLTKCTKLFVYLDTKSMLKLEQKVMNDMGENSLVISYEFSFPNLQPIKVIDEKVKVYKIIKQH